MVAIVLILLLVYGACSWSCLNKLLLLLFSALLLLLLPSAPVEPAAVHIPRSRHAHVRSFCLFP
jgi:hypothetical protein